MIWYRAVSSYATFALGVDDGRVQMVAPIGRWLLGKPLVAACEALRQRGYTVERMAK